jgi:hypothetical protein
MPRLVALELVSAVELVRDDLKAFAGLGTTQSVRDLWCAGPQPSRALERGACI